jgi:Na+:H+ antiporter
VPSREVLVVSTFAVVLFTLLIQGLSIRWVLQRVPLSPPRPSLSESDYPTDEQVIVNSSPEEPREASQ